MKKRMVIFVLTICLGVFSVCYAKVYQNKGEALKKAFPLSDEIETEEVNLSNLDKTELESRIKEKIKQDSVTFYIGKTKGEADGYCFILSEQGKHGLITFAIVISNKNRVSKVFVLESQEIRGAKITKKRFLKQFLGKGKDDPIRLKKDIDGITGATISSRAATQAVRKALIIFNVLKNKWPD